MVAVIIGAVLIFGLLIFIHEFGHFMTAKAVGIRVNEFAMGMGPVLLKRAGRETQYSLRAFPIGGYVRMEGEDEDSDDAGSFNKKPVWARAAVVAAGAVMNYLLAVILIFCLLMANNQVQTNQIAATAPGMPAAEAGLLPGDIILEIDGEPIGSWQDILDKISGGSGDTVVFIVQRSDADGQTQEVKITSQTTAEAGSGRRIVGIEPRLQHVPPNPGKAFVRSFSVTVDIMRQMLDYIGGLFVGQGSVNDLVGPVGITKLVGDSVALGWMHVVNLTAIISLNLAIVNMLPLPALDGGRLLFMFIEVVSGRRISETVEGRIHFAGFVILLALMIFITVKDVNVFILK